MIRRDFFKSLAAASAALYAGAKTVAVAVPPPAPIPKAADIPAKRLPPWKDISTDPQRALKEILKGCVAVAIKGTRTWDGPMYVEVEYRYSKDRSYPVNLNDDLPRFLSPNAGIVSVSVESMIVDDVVDLNHGFKRYPAYQPENRIIVTWVTA